MHHLSPLSACSPRHQHVTNYSPSVSPPQQWPSLWPKGLHNGGWINTKSQWQPPPSPPPAEFANCEEFRLFSRVSVLRHGTPLKLCSFSAGLDQTQLGMQEALRNSARAQGGRTTRVMWLFCSGGAAAAAQSCGHITPSWEHNIPPRQVVLHGHTQDEKATKHIWQPSLKSSYLLVVQSIFG